MGVLFYLISRFVLGHVSIPNIIDMPEYLYKRIPYAILKAILYGGFGAIVSVAIKISKNTRINKKNNEGN